MNVLIIGATGTVGGTVRERLLQNPQIHLTSLARHADRLTEATNEALVSADLFDVARLAEVIKDQDFVFVAVSGDMVGAAKAVVAAMEKTGVKRLAFISSMGIYNEVPGKDPQAPIPAILRPYRQAADLIENSALNYTIIRPGWFTRGPVDYQITHKGEPFGGHDVSLNSIADLVSQLVQQPTLYNQESIGINTPS